MTRFWSASIAELAPYVPGQQTNAHDIVKLNTNESPYGPSPRALEAIRSAADDRLRLYPDPTSRALREALATFHGLAPDQIYVGNGSDEVLAHAFLALLKQEEPLGFPDISYGFYPVYCRLFGIAQLPVPLTADFGIDLAACDRAPGPLIFPNPNAPTGITLSRDEIAALLRSRPDRLIVVDEAYVDFGAETAVPLIADFPNLLVVQTMSKSRGLAGLRVGYALGQAELIEALLRVKDSLNSYPIDRIAEAGAVASLQDQGYFLDMAQRVIAERAVLSERLGALGFDVLPSRANFVFARHGALRGGALAEALATRGILVRHFAGPRTDDFLRITVGTREQTDRLCTALDALVITDLAQRK